MNWITIISIIATAIATCFIAYFSRVSTCLAKEIKDQDKSYRDKFENLTKQHQTELSDLYQAIVISTLMGGSSSPGKMDELMTTFKKHYKGKIKIFKEGT